MNDSDSSESDSASGDELSYSESDWDGDGISNYDEINKYFTDPRQKDTDGDGWDDGDELSLYNMSSNTFNPLIADTPEVGIEMTGIPEITYKFSNSLTESASSSSAASESYTGSSQTAKSDTKTHSETSGWSNTFGVKAGYNWAVESPGGYVEIHDDLTKSSSTTSGDSYTYSSAQSSGWAKSWTNGKIKASSSEKTITGGAVKIPVKFINPSKVAYTVEKLTVALHRIPTDVAESRVFVKNLSLNDTGVFTIAPESKSGEFKLTADLEIPATEKLLKYSLGFEVEVSGYKITLQRQNQFANDFTESLTTVRAKTAAIYIDWGRESIKSSKTYNVSVRNRYNPSAGSINDSYIQPDLEYVFEKMLNKTKGSTYSLIDGSKALCELDGIANQSAIKDGAWYISHKYTENGSRKLALYTPYNTNWTLSDIKLSAGDEVSIIYSVDKDKDGVFLNEEIIYGTSDENADSDDDGLTDFEEIYGWYKNNIGLDSKYSESSKVYSSPRSNDTDGDDLLDYSADASNRDNDPVNPKVANDTSLKTVQYKGDSSEAFENFELDYYTEGDLSDLNEYVMFNIVPQLENASVKYGKSKNGPFSAFDSSTKIDLDVGDNYIYFQCKAPDETTDIYTVKAVSDFNAMKNFNVTALDNAEGFTFSWDTYSDQRALAAKNGGYILFVKEESDLSSDVSLSRSNITEALEPESYSGKKESFYLKLSESTLSGGTYKLSSVAADTKYSFYLFAYTSSNDSSKFKSKLLAGKNITSSKTSKAALKFHAHYFKSLTTHDAGSAGEYYWNVEDDSSIWGLNDISRSKTEKVEMNGNEYFCFGEAKYHAGALPSKFGSCTKTFTKNFERGKDYSFSVTWTAYEDDTTNVDWLGEVNATFKYDSSKDEWSCSWKSKGPENEGVDESGSYKIAAGSRSDGNKWQILNTSSGEVELYWDWSWDYAE